MLNTAAWYDYTMREDVYEKAIKLLSIRLHTTGELRRKLQMKGYTPADILEVLRKLEELKFLDDRRFAEMFVDNLKRYKYFGYFGIKAKLAARQVPGDVAAAVLAEFFSAEDEQAVAERLLKKLKRAGKNTYEKQARAFASRGFRSDVIHSVLVKE